MATEGADRNVAMRLLTPSLLGAGMTSAFMVSPIPAELLLGGVEEDSLFRSRLGGAVLGGGGDTGRHGDIEGQSDRLQ